MDERIQKYIRLAVTARQRTNLGQPFMAYFFARQAIASEEGCLNSTYKKSAI